MDKYCGARFYKCDLHMHSPFDESWTDSATKLKSGDSDDRKREVARAYLKACHSAGLEVIAITDHNLASHAGPLFIEWLVAENHHVAEDVGKSPLTIFPGFEIQADVGKGHHVICVLPLGLPRDVIEGRLVECGVQADARFEKSKPKASTKRLAEIIEAVQKCKGNRGVVISAHPFGEKGMLCDESAEIWLQQEEFKNLDLLCIEVPKVIGEMPQGLRKLIEGGEDCAAEWKRDRPVAYIMSSDCHRMTADTSDGGNSIGYRSTWIKMSEPSIESLRQAFLDRDSRIRFGSVKPDTLYKHPRIERIQVQGASFYRADPVVLSGNLNCVIGSRGTGKSTLIDYVRLALDRLGEDDLPPRIKAVVEGRNWGTLDPNSSITVDVRRDGVPYRVECTMTSGLERKVINMESGECDQKLDIRSLFNVRFLSQHEIDDTVDINDLSRLRRLLDGFITTELDALMQVSKDTVSKMELLNIRLDELKEGQKLRAVLETDKAQLQATLKLLERLKEPLQRWQGLLTEESEVQRLIEWCATVVIEFRKRVNELCLPVPVVADTTNKAMVSEAVTAAKGAVQSFADSIADSIAAFESATLAQDSSVIRLIDERWVPVYEKEKDDFEAIKKELEAAGDDPKKFLEYKKQLDETEIKLQRLDEELKEIDQLESKRGDLLGTLRKCWWRETERREMKAKELMDRLRMGGGQTPLVEIRVEHEGELSKLAGAMDGFIGDKRSLNRDDVESVIEAIAQRVRESWISGEEGEKVSIVQEVLNECRLGTESSAIRRALSSSTRFSTFVRTFNESAIRKLETRRIPDTVTLLVHLQDGTLAGPIEKVSAGQKGLAFLNLLLAGGDEPLVIDTPEEGLDNEGVYYELVPLFRREKETRQIIVAPHNANIPVNADAELVLALESVGFVPEEKVKAKCAELGEGLSADQVRHVCDLINSRGWERESTKYLVESRKWAPDKARQFTEWVGSQRQAIGVAKSLKPTPSHETMVCTGGLDRWSVKEAVLTVMEGSKKAFEKRREKYGF